MANPLPNKRVIGKEDMARMNIPQPLWGASVEQIPDSVKRRVANYLDRIKEARIKGVGLYLWGNPGVGKSGIGSVILKEARSWGFTTLFISVSMLRDAVRERKMFDAEMSILERARTVDFLVLDGLAAQDLEDRFFTAFDIRSLILARNDCLRVTIVTSTLDPSEFRAMEKSYLIDALSQSIVTLLVDGEDLRVKAMEIRKQFLE